MQVIKYAQFRRSMKAKLDQISDDGNTVIIKRREHKYTHGHRFSSQEVFSDFQDV